MTTERLTTVVFDLGAVLIDWDPRYVFRDLFPGDEPGMERFLTEVANSAWNHQMDAGRSWAEAVADLVARHPEQRALIEAYRRRWPEMLGGQIEGTVDVLAELRAARFRLFALTNWSAETFPIALERFEFLSWFDGIVVSGVEGVAKPEAAIFQALFERHLVEPGEALFIDDRPDNVAAAEALGMKALRFHSPERLRADLAAFGLLASGADETDSRTDPD